MISFGLVSNCIMLVIVSIINWFCFFGQEFTNQNVSCCWITEKWQIHLFYFCRFVHQFQKRALRVHYSINKLFPVISFVCFMQSNSFFFSTAFFPLLLYLSFQPFFLSFFRTKINFNFNRFYFHFKFLIQIWLLNKQTTETKMENIIVAWLNLLYSWKKKIIRKIKFKIKMNKVLWNSHCFWQQQQQHTLKPKIENKIEE